MIRSSWVSIHQADGHLTATQQIGVHETLLCVLFVLEILCSSTKNNFCVGVGYMVCFSCVWVCFICVSFKITHEYWVRVCLLWIDVVIEHIVNSKWFQIRTSWTRKFPEHMRASIRWEDLVQFRSREIIRVQSFPIALKLTGTSAAMLPRCLATFRALRSL